jgi:predicted Co/Zn/Cd cation transporter (cation efflux family)
MLWAWEPGYETYNHLVWLVIAFAGTFVIGLCSSDAVTGLQILFGGGQLVAFAQEAVRTLVSRKLGCTDSKYSIKNVFGSITGIAFGGIIAFVSWRILN